MPCLFGTDDEEGHEVQPEHDQCGHEGDFRNIIEEAIGRLASPVNSSHNRRLSHKAKLREATRGSNVGAEMGD